jgi:hypothetical protein
MGRPYTESGSCRDCVHDGKLAEELMYSACQEHSRYSDKTLRRRSDRGDIDIEGVCHLLHGPLSQPTVGRRAAANSPSLRRRRKRVVAENI